MNYLFLMDPLETVVFEKDTTFVLMLEAQRRGYGVFYLPKNGILRENGKTSFHVTRAIPQNNKDNPFSIAEEQTLSEDQVDVIFIRTDPPFDTQYLTHTWLLDLLPKRIKVINNPTGIRTVSEKLWATQFIDLHPSTIVGRNKEDLLNFLHKHQHIIVKPTDGHGGKSIFNVKVGDSNASVIFEKLTDHGKVDIICQEFVKESDIGDKRILLLNGEPLGAVLRVHAEGEHRNNFFSGGKAVATEITDRDLEIIKVLKPQLQKLGLYFVGIDIMGKHLIEVNVTSPTCLQEMNRLYNLQLESKVIDFVDQLKV